MKRSLLPALLAALAVTAPLVSAEENVPVRSISVTGTMQTKIAPDQVLWNIQLIDTDPDMRKAKTASDERIKAVLALREKLGVKEGDLETGTVNIRREYHENERGRRGEFKHFVVRRGVTIRQRDLKRFDEFLDSLVASTEMEVSFSFDSSKRHEARADTRIEALKIARDKAAKMAETVGAKLGQVLTINEHGSGGSFHGNLMAQNAVSYQGSPGVDASSDRFVPGAINVQVTVYATFELE